MFMFHSVTFISILLPISCFLALAYASWCPHHCGHQSNMQFQQKTDRFWEFNEETNSWVEVELPYDLISCVNDNCSKVGTISRLSKKTEDRKKEYDVVPEQRESSQKKDGHGGREENFNRVLPQRKRISLTKMSETSIWVTGESGSIYERYWNGLQWVLAPHDLPVFADHAISVFIVNQTILALGESGVLYQMQVSESSQAVWVEFTPMLNQSTGSEGEHNSGTLLKLGVVSPDEGRVYFCTTKGTLLELAEIEPPRFRWGDSNFTWAFVP